MAQDFIIRTEDVRPEDILDLFVPIQRDRDLVEKLKSTSPLIIEGSRGTGKSLLLRVCEQEQLKTFERDRVLAVYLSFARSSLIDTDDRQQFQHWMLASLCLRVLRTITQAGLVAAPTSAVQALSGGSIEKVGDRSKLEIVAEKFEESYKQRFTQIDVSVAPQL